MVRDEVRGVFQVKRKVLKRSFAMEGTICW